MGTTDRHNGQRSEIQSLIVYPLTRVCVFPFPGKINNFHIWPLGRLEVFFRPVSTSIIHFHVPVHVHSVGRILHSLCTRFSPEKSISIFCTRRNHPSLWFCAVKSDCKREPLNSYLMYCPCPLCSRSDNGSGSQLCTSSMSKSTNARATPAATAHCFHLVNKLFSELNSKCSNWLHNAHLLFSGRIEMVLLESLQEICVMIESYAFNWNCRKSGVRFYDVRNWKLLLRLYSRFRRAQHLHIVFMCRNEIF